MKIVIAGGTGFLGRPLTTHLSDCGHRVVLLTRGRTRAASSPGVRMVAWNPDGSTGPWASEIEGADAVVNLAGESIAGRRWSDQHKRNIRDSRIRATGSLVEAIGRCGRPPSVFISGSAVGIYGPRGDEVVTEETPAGSDFLATVCVAWEAWALRAATAQTRVACIRTGLVIEKDGGALAAMMPPFRFGAGGPLGSGRQYWPWIHRADWVGLVRWAMETPAVRGPFNATAPAPVTNADFARALGKAIHRPSFMPAPAFALRLALGEMADALLLSGQRAVPAEADRRGYAFRYPRLDDALADIFHGTSG